MRFIRRLTRLQAPPLLERNDLYHWLLNLRDAIGELQNFAEDVERGCQTQNHGSWVVLDAGIDSLEVVADQPGSIITALAPIREGYTVEAVEVFGRNPDTSVRELMIRLREMEGMHNDSGSAIIGQRMSSLVPGESWTTRISGQDQGLPRLVRPNNPMFLELLSDGSVGTETRVVTIKWTFRKNA